MAEDEASEVLSGWGHADAFECRWSSGGTEDAMTVARALLGPSRSARQAPAGRDLLVAPFGVRPAHQGDVLLYPLDFRVIVTLSGGVARCTTVVLRRGVFGAAYCTVLGPFHRRLISHLRRCQHHSHTAEADAS